MQTAAICIVITFILTFIYIILVNFFTTLFVLTGLSKEKAFFQTLSLMTACGFTTSETEFITYEPVRRKIAKACMITGYVFSTLIVSLVIGIIVKLDWKGENGVDYWMNVLITLGVTLLVFIFLIIMTKIPVLRNLATKAIKKMFYNRISKTGNQITIYDQIAEKFIIMVYVNKVPSALRDKKISEMNLSKVDVSIISISNEEKGYNTANIADMKISKGDRVTLLGDKNTIEKIFSLK